MAFAGGDRVVGFKAGDECRNSLSSLVQQLAFGLGSELGICSREISDSNYDRIDGNG